MLLCIIDAASDCSCGTLLNVIFCGHLRGSSRCWVSIGCIAVLDLDDAAIHLGFLSTMTSGVPEIGSAGRLLRDASGPRRLATRVRCLKSIHLDIESSDRMTT